MVKVGERYRYRGPWDPCAEYGPHPYAGQVGTVIAVVTVPPAPERPITIRFADGTTEVATLNELGPARG
ncbi:MAG: hypothetical protein HY689_08130 [Chloroflexi bacterium]|nr:hypothetical protein [Chloroflexota bacterium]